LYLNNINTSPNIILRTEWKQILIELTCCSVNYILVNMKVKDTFFHLNVNRDVTLPEINTNCAL